MEKTIHTAAYRHLIEWLKSIREEKGIRMRELAVMLNVSPSWVAKVEQLERRLDILEYVRLCNCLGIEPVKGLTKIKSELNKKSR